MKSTVAAESSLQSTDVFERGDSVTRFLLAGTCWARGYVDGASEQAWRLGDVPARDQFGKVPRGRTWPVRGGGFSGALCLLAGSDCNARQRLIVAARGAAGLAERQSMITGIRRPLSCGALCGTL